MGLMQKELAKKIGMSRSSIYEWENGRKKPLKKNLERIYDVLI